MEDPAKAIESAFSKLKQNAGYVLHSSTLNEILYMADAADAEEVFHKSPPFPGMPISKHPMNWKSCSLRTAGTEITKIRKAFKCGRIQEALRNTHQTTIHALLMAGFYSQEGDVSTKTTIEIIDKAETIISGWKKQYPKRISSCTGQPKKKIPFRIAMLLAEEYYQATGRKPTLSRFEDIAIEQHVPYGPFFDLVKTVFGILNVKASPQAMTREAGKLWRKREAIREKAVERMACKAD